MKTCRIPYENPAVRDSARSVMSHADVCGSANRSRAVADLRKRALSAVLRWRPFSGCKISILVDPKQISVVSKSDKQKKKKKRSSYTSYRPFIRHWGPSCLFCVWVGGPYSLVGAPSEGGPVSSCWPCWLLNPPLIESQILKMLVWQIPWVGLVQNTFGVKNLNAFKTPCIYDPTLVEIHGVTALCEAACSGISEQWGFSLA